MTHTFTVKKGTGLKLDDSCEFFQNGKDWLLMNFKDGSARWMDGKRQVNNMLKMQKEVCNEP